MFSKFSPLTVDQAVPIQTVGVRATLMMAGALAGEGGPLIGEERREMRPLLEVNAWTPTTIFLNLSPLSTPLTVSLICQTKNWAPPNGFVQLIWPWWLHRFILFSVYWSLQSTTTPGGYVIEEFSDDEIAFENDDFDDYVSELIIKVIR